MKHKLVTVLLVMSTAVFGQQGKTKVQLQYIEKYYPIAIAEMKQFGIPASITLAQGLLESAAGQSYLAVEGNNHFGIKCHLDWDGKRLYRDDDAKNECFRGYENAAASFRDHSEFLKYRSRYAFLFEESPTDYKAWAKGLKKAGYATDRRYPARLIELIERYELHKYDLDGFEVTAGEVLAAKEKEASPEEKHIKAYQINVSKNYVKFVIAKKGDTFQSIAAQIEVSEKRLLRYNELEEVPVLKGGERLYIQPKRRKAHLDNKLYTVKAGETVYDVAQKFAIKKKYIYKRNKDLAEGEALREGQVLELR
jgi:LysM repeat protein